MTNNFPTASQIYLTEGNTVIRHSTYTPGSVMNYIHKYSPVFSYLCQRSRLDTFLDDPQFNGTCFVPFPEFSSKYFDHLKGIDRQTARVVVLQSILPGLVYSHDISSVQIPSLSPLSYVFSDSPNQITNGYDSLELVKTDISKCNGIVHIVNGVFPPSCLKD